jgi:hypothetical protein
LSCVVGECAFFGTEKRTFSSFFGLGGMILASNLC